MCFFNNIIIEQEERPLFPWRDQRREKKYVGKVLLQSFHVRSLVLEYY